MPAIGSRVVVIGRDGHGTRRSIIRGTLQGTRFRGGTLFAIVVDAAKITHIVPVLALRERGQA